MSSAQRIAVWNGERAQTTGGLKKADLIKSRHGRIVSKKKSEVARKLNNLGNFLASKGAKAAKAKAEPKPKAAKPQATPSPTLKLADARGLVTELDLGPNLGIESGFELTQINLS